jgi:hypothetical protein
MTEAEWLTSTSVGDMLRFLRYTKLGPEESTSARKYRLFAVACARRTWDTLREIDRDAVLIAEQWADRLAAEAELHHARTAGARRNRPKDAAEVSEDGRDRCGDRHAQGISDTSSPLRHLRQPL